MIDTTGIRGRSRSLRKRLTIASLCVGLVASVAACGGGGSSGGDNEPYLIGVTDDLSGPVSAYGQALQKVWTAYVDKVNEAGGVHGKKLKLEVLDDKSDTTTMVQNVHKLLSDGAIAIDGSTLSTNCLAAAPVVTKAKVPMSCWAVSNELVGTDNKYIFTRVPLGELETKPTMDFGKTIAKNSPPRLAVLGNSSGTCQAFAKKAKSLASSEGWDLVANLSADLADGTDMTAPAAQVDASKADVFVYCVSGQGVTELPKRLQSLGSNIASVAVSSDEGGLMLLKDPNFYQLWLKDYTPPNPTTPEAKDYVKTLATQGISGADLNLAQVGQAYFAIDQIVESLKKCTTNCTGDQLAKQMQQTVIEIPGVTGPSGFGYKFPDRQMPVTSVGIFHYDPTTQQPKQVGSGYDLGTE